MRRTSPRHPSPDRQPLSGTSLVCAGWRCRLERGLLFQGNLHRSLGVCQGRVDQRHRAVPGFEEHAELGAFEDHGLRAAPDKIRDRGLELLPCGRQKYALGNFSVHGAVHVLLVLAFGDKDINSVVLPQTADEVAAGHRVPTAEEPDGRDSSLLNLVGGRIDMVQERAVHSALDPISSCVDGVAGQ